MTSNGEQPAVSLERDTDEHGTGEALKLRDEHFSVDGLD